MENQSKRNYLFDNIKFLLIFLVVLGHFIDFYATKVSIFRSLFLFIYSFHMPLFIFISGLFYNNKNIGKKCIFYISCGFALKIVIALGEKIINHGNINFSLLSDGGLPWFMFVLAMCMLAVYLLKNQNKKYIFIASIVLALFVGYDQTIGNYLYLSRFIIMFPFYLLGSMMDFNKIADFKSKRKWLILPSLLILLVWLFICRSKLDNIYYIRYLFTAKNPFFDELLSTGAFVRLQCYLTSFIIGTAVIFIVPSREIPFVSNAGKNTLNVYFYHYTVLTFLYSFNTVKELIKLGRSGKILILLISLLVTVILSFNIFSFPLKQIKNMIYKSPK